MKALVLFFLFATISAHGAFDGLPGESCQRDFDCASLVCNQNIGKCAKSAGDHLRFSGESCTTKYNCRAQDVSVCRVYKIMNNPERGLVRCAIRCFPEARAMSCLDNLCTPPTVAVPELDSVDCNDAPDIADIERSLNTELIPRPAVIAASCLCDGNIAYNRMDQRCDRLCSSSTLETKNLAISIVNDRSFVGGREDASLQVFDEFGNYQYFNGPYSSIASAYFIPVPALIDGKHVGVLRNIDRDELPAFIFEVR